MNRVTYSIIIPHRNCPELLRRCIDSIPVRDDVQIIVVDDNSDQEKKPSIERAGLEIVLLDAEHSKGAGRARNVGLSKALGKWLLFSDADDYFTDALPSLMDKYVDDEVTDIVYLNARTFNEKGEQGVFKTDSLIRNYLHEKKDSEMRLRYELWTPWSRMVKRELALRHNLRFDEVPATNDKMFCLQCSLYSKNIKAEDVFVYNYYRPTKGSITDKQRDSKMLDGLLDIRRRTIELYKKAGYKELPSFWAVLYRTSYVKDLSIFEIIRKYIGILRLSKTSILKDQYRFIRKKSRDRLNK